MLDTGGLVGKRENLCWSYSAVWLELCISPNPEHRRAPLGQFRFLCCSNIINTGSFHSYR